MPAALTSPQTRLRACGKPGRMRRLEPLGRCKMRRLDLLRLVAEAASRSRNQIVSSCRSRRRRGSRAGRTPARPERRATAVGLALAADEEPHRSGAVERLEGQADPLRRRLGGLGDRDRDASATSSPGGRGTARRRGRRGPSRASRPRTRRRRARALGAVRRGAGADVRGGGRGGHLVHVRRATPTASRNAVRA